MNDISARQPRRKTYPTQERLKELFTYDPKGFLVWKERPVSVFPNERICKVWNKKYAGRRAGCPDNKGYWRTSIPEGRFRIHRLIWIFHNGQIPEGLEIDHDDGVRDHNCIKNLNCVDDTGQSRNAKKRKDNTSGISGVHFIPLKRKWQARFHSNGKTVYVGSAFPTREAAAAALSIARKLAGFSERHGT